jgi:hypothetical protein
MGYRSNVTIAFYTRKPDELPGAAVKLWFDENYPHREAVDEWGAEIKTGGGWILVTYQDVKWYSGYDHVQNVQRALDSFDVCFDANEKDLAAWELARVGENEDDIETERSGYCDYQVDVRREIVTGFE